MAGGRQSAEAPCPAVIDPQKTFNRRDRGLQGSHSLYGLRAIRTGSGSILYR